MRIGEVVGSRWLPVFDCLISKMTRSYSGGDSRRSSSKTGRSVKGEKAGDGRTEWNARKPKTLQKEIQPAERVSGKPTRCWPGGREGKREETMCASKRYSRWNSGEREDRGEGKGAEGGLDFWCIGVLIPTLNYPLSWAQLGPLVKTPPLFVLRSR